MVICLEQGADLHMAQLMPLPLTVSCFIKIQIGFTFLVPAHLGSPGQRTVKRVCVCGWVCYRCNNNSCKVPAICSSLSVGNDMITHDLSPNLSQIHTHAQLPRTIRSHYNQSVCLQHPTYTDNVALPASALHTVLNRAAID